MENWDTYELRRDELDACLRKSPAAPAQLVEYRIAGYVPLEALRHPAQLEEKPIAHHNKVHIVRIVERLNHMQKLAEHVIYRDTLHQLSFNTDRIIRKEAGSLGPVTGLDDDDGTLAIKDRGRTCQLEYHQSRRVLP